MADSEKMTTRFRRLLTGPETTVMPFGVLPIHAQMAQHAGYEAFEISGGMSAWWIGGAPDSGLLTQTEMVAHAARVVRSVDIPVYCDADTGYGGVVNVWRTTQEFIHAGVAGIHIEDQREPKKSGGGPGVELVSDVEAVGRLRAAIDARDALDPDFVIVARTDGYGAAGGSLAEAIRRGNLYKREAGADLIFYEGLRTWDEARVAIAETEGPAYAIVSKDARPTPSLAEQTAMGQAMSVLRFILPGVQEVWNLLLKARQSGSFAPVDEYLDAAEQYRGTDFFVGHGDRFVRPTYAQVRALEERYLPTELQRDYATESTDSFR
jgi:2-methylisocitrate lyase-like PEP mutase family enzyme